MRQLVFTFWLLAWTATFGMEVTAPPTAQVTATNAIVHWHTDVNSGTRAQLSPASTKILVPDKTPGTDHTVILSGLQPGTTYTVTVGSARLWLAKNTFTTSGSSGSVLTNAKTVSAKKDVPAGKSIPSAPPTQKIWGNPSSLPDHFARHGADFNAKDADHYARMSWQFLQDAKSKSWPAKVDDEGVLRIYESKSGTFASYNSDGTTKTFFKPGSPDYFDRQPGRVVTLKAGGK